MVVVQGGGSAAWTSMVEGAFTLEPAARIMLNVALDKHYHRIQLGCSDSGHIEKIRYYQIR